MRCTLLCKEGTELREMAEIFPQKNGQPREEKRRTRDSSLFYLKDSNLHVLSPYLTFKEDAFCCSLVQREKLRLSGAWNKGIKKYFILQLIRASVLVSFFYIFHGL